MASSLSTQLTFTFQSILTLVNSSITANFGTGFVWANGTLINQSDELYAPDPLVITNSSTPFTIDLNGTLFQPGGATLNLLEVTCVGIINNDATNYINWGPAASNGVTSIFSGTTPKKRIGPKGMDICFNPYTTAYGITAGSADVIAVNCESGTNIGFSIIVIGRSA